MKKRERGFIGLALGFILFVAIFVIGIYMYTTQNAPLDVPMLKK